jgi:hypothetical protein
VEIHQCDVIVVNLGYCRCQHFHFNIVLYDTILFNEFLHTLIYHAHYQLNHLLPSAPCPKHYTDNVLYSLSIHYPLKSSVILIYLIHDTGFVTIKSNSNSNFTFSWLFALMNCIVLNHAWLFFGIESIDYWLFCYNRSLKVIEDIQLCFWQYSSKKHFFCYSRCRCYHVEIQ